MGLSRAKPYANYAEAMLDYNELRVRVGLDPVGSMTWYEVADTCYLAAIALQQAQDNSQTEFFAESTKGPAPAAVNRRRFRLEGDD